MIKTDLLSEFDAAVASRSRTAMATALDTAGLRELGPEILARSVFSANAVSAIYASKLKEVIDELTSGRIGEGQARTALYICLDELGYTPEGGFPGEAGDVPPAVKGTLQDLRSFRRMNLVVRTQVDLMGGAGLQARGSEPISLATHPAWELVRAEPRKTPRDWEARWVICGGKVTDGRMIALKGDPVWGELGSYDNFQDALGVDHPPFAFESGMWWDEVEAAECDELGITGPAGESAADFFASQPQTLAGRMELPEPSISMAGVDPGLRDKFIRDTGATPHPSRPHSLEFSRILARELEKTHGKRP